MELIPDKSIGDSSQWLKWYAEWMFVADHRPLKGIVGPLPHAEAPERNPFK